ncbi:MAG TPA: SDR family NAD(P)-dependent oxidoreductase, partial [Dysgonamonadaceae bacterium]|nr:SDR family NAD(P)-dependent oxidoreductase [Dysgonamonadaceae bacterium]
MKNNIFNIHGRVAIVTGATGVLGGSIANSLVEARVKVVAMGRNDKKLNEKIEELKKLSDDKESVMGFTCNILDVDELKQVREKIIEKWGRIDILVNCAGGNIPEATLQESQSLFDLSLKGWNEVIDVNLNGSVYPSFVFGEAMAEQKEGSIINVSSMATYSAISRVPGYSVAKTGVNIFTQWMAMEMAV